MVDFSNKKDEKMPFDIDDTMQDLKELEKELKEMKELQEDIPKETKEQDKYIEQETRKQNKDITQDSIHNTTGNVEHRIEEPQKNEQLIKELSQDITEEDMEIPTPKIPMFENEKDKKEYLKELKKKHWKNRIKKVLGTKEEKQQELKEIEKQLLYDETPIDKVKTYFTKRGMVKVGLIHKNNNITWHKPTLKSKTIEIGNGLYNVRTNAIVRDKGFPTLFYYDGNPNPIIFDSDKNEALVNSEAMYSLWNNKIVQDLLRGSGDLITKEKLLTFGTLLGFAVLFAIMTGQFDEGGALEGVFSIFMIYHKGLFEKIKGWFK